MLVYMYRVSLGIGCVLCVNAYFLGIIICTTSEVHNCDVETILNDSE